MIYKTGESKTKESTVNSDSKLLWLNLLILLLFLVLISCTSKDELTISSAYFGVASSSTANPYLYTVTATVCDNGVCDLTGPLKAALLACDTNPPRPEEDRAGCAFQLPAGTFKLTEPIVLYRQHRIMGPMCGGRFSGSCIKINSDQTAFELASIEEGIATGRGLGSPGSVIERLYIARTTFENPEEHYGIDIRGAKARIREVQISGFTIGINVSSDINRQSNANLFEIYDVRVTNCQHTGIYMQGGDANAGLISLYDGTSNCQRWKTWESKFGVCANLVDKSFLGNTTIASHTAVCKDLDTDDKCSGYHSEGDSQRSAFFGNYQESDQINGVISKNSVSLGGLAMWSGDGLHVLGTLFSGMRIRNDKDPSNVVEFWVGNVTASGAAFEVRADEYNFNWPLALRAHSDGYWTWQLANLSSRRLIRMYGKDNIGGKLGELWLAPVGETLRFGQLGSFLCPLEIGGICP